MDAVNRPHEEQEPEPPPVKNIEYPTLTAAPSAEKYIELPYGSDFGSEAAGATHPEAVTPTAVNAAAEAPVADGERAHLDLSAGAAGPEIAGSPERKS